MFHSFNENIENIAFPEQFTYPFNYTPHRLSILAADAVKSYVAKQTKWSKELQRGKMFGVLVVRDKNSGEVGFLAAFSSTLDGKNSHEFFVPPIFDMLRDDGYFREEERSISLINSDISNLKNDQKYRCLQGRYSELRERAEKSLEKERFNYKKCKIERDKERNSPKIEKKRVEELNRESQFQKGELKRLERAFKGEILSLEVQIKEYKDVINKKIEERQRRSLELQKWLFSQYVMLNGRGERQNLIQIFEKERIAFPPSGAGECAAPKLIQYCYSMGYDMISMAEFWWGDSPKGEVRRHFNYYPSCNSRCKPILSFMLQGIDVERDPDELTEGKLVEIDIVFEDEEIVVVDKPEGLLSVEGKGDKSSVSSFLKQKYGNKVDLFPAHRLDMDTSGLLIFAKSIESYINLQKQFLERQVKKRYVALIEKEPQKRSGIIKIPLIADISDRPRQKIDYEKGKMAVTRYEVVGTTIVGSVDKRCEFTKIALYPQTGRTHQLRVHTSHKDGLDSPIVGDRLYGDNSKSGCFSSKEAVNFNRLYLHAQTIEFKHPKSGKNLKFVSKFDF